MNDEEAREPNFQKHGITAMNVLDHGFVALRNISGPTRRAGKASEHYTAYEVRQFDADDRDPAQAARMSFDNMFEERTAQQDADLCDYLMRNRHTSPFEMVEVWLEMKLPIFVARQFVRHRTVSMNEVSGRYVTLPAQWYIPEVVGAKPSAAKQGQQNTLSKNIQREFQEELQADCQNSYYKYLSFLKDNVAPEHARMFLHLNHYSHWLWKQNLHNLMHFLSLRDHSHAQIEAQLYAKAIDKLIRAHLPLTMGLYDKYRKQTNGV